MGTSKRRLNEKVKKILAQNTVEELNNSAPEISEAVLTKKNLVNSLENEKVVDHTIEVVSKRFSSLSKKGFKGKSKKELIEDELTQQEFLELILEEIEQETTIDSKILKKSLKIVMAKFFNQEFDAYTFAQLLFFEVIYQLLLRDLYDTLKDSFEELSYNQIENMVKTLASKIVNNQVHEKINMFVDKKLSFGHLLDVIVKETTEAEFGEF